MTLNGLGWQDADAPAASSPPPVTLYRRIRDDLRERIRSGAWQPLDRVSSESELMRRYRVSRITVRQALSDLVAEGLIFKRAGKGSFVAPPRPFQELGRLQGLAEAMQGRGHETRSRVVAARPEPASPAVAERLGLGVGAPVTHIERVRCLDGRPLSVDATWLPARLGERVLREDLETRDVFLILEQDCATPLGHADLAIDAVRADAATARLLEVDAGAALLRIERLTCDTAGRPVDYERLLCRVDRFQYRLRLARH